MPRRSFPDVLGEASNIVNPAQMDILALQHDYNMYTSTHLDTIDGLDALVFQDGCSGLVRPCRQWDGCIVQPWRIHSTSTSLLPQAHVDFPQLLIQALQLCFPLASCHTCAGEEQVQRAARAVL